MTIGGLQRIEIASLRANLLPTLISIYSFPMELQITVSGFVCAVQALLFIFLGRKA